MASLGSCAITCPMCGATVDVPVSFGDLRHEDGHLIWDVGFDSLTLDAHPCLLRVKHQDWDDEMDNTYPSWP